MTNIVITATNVANHPAKVQTFLTKALNRGLAVEQAGVGIAHASYTVRSPNPIDDFELWMYFRSGRNGGSLELVRYAPVTTKRSNTTKLTRLQAGILLDDMGDALDRHHEREAAKHIAQGLDVVRAVEAARTARAAVQAVKETPAPQVDPETQALAVAALGTLKANGRFALRMAHHGRIFANTTGVVRTALINRNLVHASGGILTELGRTVRDLILNP